ncbi:histone deacetylase 4-like isoform X5 [Amphibalanus amphitrite]|uniref:histone deacetylase 4-like isoform X5 n=3 Tax=Amphibalanus amphitrite TaxID=1232801 RepID=UPI001C9128FB|nr:histone deacetylase 4-like isoform X5 [Amphibalanus amphitrite]
MPHALPGNRTQMAESRAEPAGTQAPVMEPAAASAPDPAPAGRSPLHSPPATELRAAAPSPPGPSGVQAGPSGAPPPPATQTDTSARKSPMMEINSAFTHLPPKPEVNSGSPTLVRSTDSNNMANAWHDASRHDAFQQQLLQMGSVNKAMPEEMLRLRQQQELQQRFLVEQFQAQQQQLTEQHEKQLQQHIKEYQETQKKREEQQLALEKERREQDRLEQLKKKDVRHQSAVASTEVKQRLQEFVLQKKQREAAAASSPYRNCGNTSGRNSLVHQRSTEKANATSHPYRPPVLSKYDDEFCPLRKTASEPNISLKARIKQRVLERCAGSPLGRRFHEQAGRPIKHKSKLTLESSTSTPESDPSSPPSASYLMAGGRGGTPIQEEAGGLPFHLAGLSGGGAPEVSLYSSPSMPNISLGRPPVHTAVSSGSSEGEPSRPGPYPPLIPIGAPMMTAPFFPILPVIDSECTPPTSPAYIRKQMESLEQVRNPLLGGLYPQHGITCAEAAQARLGRTIQGRPLSRTQSAPLPLGHPLLQRASLTREQYEQLVKERQLYEQQHQHNLLKQHIRQTVLTRASSKNHVENVEEETEAAVAREMQDAKDAEVIDLTENRIDVSEVREEPSHQMGLSGRHGPPPNSRVTHAIRPLARAFSSPLVTLNPAATASPARDPHITYVSKQGCGTGLVYDPLMLKHQCVCGDSSNHPEHSARLQYIWSRLQETGLTHRCDRIRSRKATLEEIQTCHSEAHTIFFGTNPLNRQKLDLGKLGELPIRSFVKMPCGGIGVDLDTTWNELHTSSAARMAAGCVSELALKVAMGAVKNGFALVRPPGHHAERQQAMGFCFFNSVAVAARLLRLQLSVEKVMIVDWDVHHGNGTQQLFYDSSHVLYLSLHRHDDGNFFPGTGAPVECGVEDGMGFNVNVAWSGGCSPPMGDAEYLAAFRSIVMPIARDFQPDVVLVSSGFDAARGHPSPLGGYQVSAQCFAWMTRQMMTLANGKVAMALEGGYDIPAICDATEHTIRALLGDDLQPISDEELNRKPCQAAIDTLRKTIDIQVPHWPCVKRTAHLIPLSHAEALKDRDAETLSAMAGLTVHHRHAGQPPAAHQSPPPAACRSSPARPVSPTQEEPMEQDESEAK